VKQSLIKIENLHKNYGKKLIFDNLSLEIFTENILGVFGFSGSGKTTFLNMVCGFEKFSKGNILYRTYNKKKKESKYVPIFSNSKQIKSLIGFSTQEFSFYLELSVYDNLKYFGILHEIKLKDLKIQIDKILKILDLEESKNTLGMNLSEGMKKRLDIACALIHNPKILILDEPTANLDYQLRKSLLNYILKIHKSGIGVIFVSHFIEEMKEICTEFLLINSSHTKLVENTKTTDLKKVIEGLI